MRLFCFFTFSFFLFSLIAGPVLSDSAPLNCDISSTLKLGSAGSQVKCLQAIVGAEIDGKFGPMTRARVMALQYKPSSLARDGVFGPMSRVVWLSQRGTASESYPEGCISSEGYSSTTGAKCK